METLSISSATTQELKCRCFPHIVNLACKAVLTSITEMKYASEQAADYIPGWAPAVSIIDAIDRDPIATVQSLICTVGV